MANSITINIFIKHELLKMMRLSLKKCFAGDSFMIDSKD